MQCYQRENQTAVREFLLLGIAVDQDHRAVFIVLFLILYLLSLSGNTFVVAAANLDIQLRIPMYFFLGNLSFVDLCLTSVTVPKYIANLLSMNVSISYQGCITQMYLFIWLAAMENFLLAVMSYDRYVAICNPLHYTLVLNQRLCFLLVVTSWILTSLHASLHVSLILQLCFCGPNAIHSFFCDQPPVLSLSCSDTSVNHLMILSEGLFLAILVFFFILGTYILIITSILRLHTTHTRQKAFFTCSSHLTVVALFYLTIGSVYLIPSSVTSREKKTGVSTMYALVAPTLNPFIYSLRNKEIKSTLRKVIKKTSIFYLLNVSQLYLFSCLQFSTCLPVYL